MLRPSCVWAQTDAVMQTLDRKLSSLEAGTSQAADAVESAVADTEDLLSYANDVLNTGMPLTLNCTLT